MSALPKTAYWTAKEYLAMEREAEYKSEYFDGQIVAIPKGHAVAGASERHNLITTNVSGEFYLQFKKRTCKAYSSDMRVKVSKTVYLPRCRGCMWSSTL
jgi:Uma2 family endonuclease